MSSKPRRRFTLANVAQVPVKRQSNLLEACARGTQLARPCFRTLHHLAVVFGAPMTSGAVSPCSSCVSAPSGLLAVDASGFERTVALTPDLAWEVDVFGMPILDTVLRNQQARIIFRPWACRHEPAGLFVVR